MADRTRTPEEPQEELQENEPQNEDRADTEANVADDMAKQIKDDAVDVDEAAETEVTDRDLESELVEARAKADEYLRRLQHLQADFQNYKKRKEKEQAEVFTMIEDRLLGEFLPLFDDLSRAFEVYAQDKQKDILIEGLERIFAKFQDFLDSKEIRPIKATGQKFDPNLHEVLMSVESDQDPNTVLDEYERGFTRQGRLLRASRVTVSKRPAKSRPEESKAESSTEDSDSSDDKKENNQHDE